ncbi:MAG: DUF4105 domain-containing protein, partial [Bacteroidaceae bacterium]|nr:DUF4105 domain-containing protein [Bacteroidaceae bacterium]
MKRSLLFVITLSILSLTGKGSLYAQAVDSSNGIVIRDSANFVKASLMIAEPFDKHPQSSFGHTFLRMQCTEALLDYCFSIESGDYEGFLDICRGNYPNRLIAFPTKEYIASFNKEGRLVTEHPLNTTLQDGQRLWELLDSISLAGLIPYHDFFHHGCSQELIRYLDWGLNGSIVYGKNAEKLDKTLLSLNFKQLPSNNWVRLFLAMYVTTDASDRILRPDEKTVMPCVTAEVLSDAQIASPDGGLRPLLKSEQPIQYIPHKPYRKSQAPPIYVWFGLLLACVVIISIMSYSKKGETTRISAKLTDIILFMGYNTISLSMLAIYYFSEMTTLSGWNWNYLIYNP